MNHPKLSPMEFFELIVSPDTAVPFGGNYTAVFVVFFIVNGSAKSASAPSHSHAQLL